MMLRKIAHFIAENHLLSLEGKCLAALSGGADSVALLLALRKLGYDVEAVHCNFHLRGAESDRDEQFCLALCKRENIPFHRIHFDTTTYASLHKMSVEMSARTLRYQYFEQLRRDVGAQAVCVAHHSDDQAETVLLNLIRGTGIQGLMGMTPRNGAVVRPLLCVSRKEIECWLARQNQPFVTDSTNLMDDATRNKIRLNVLPLLRSINPSVSEHLVKTARLLREAGKMADSALPTLTEKSAEGFRLPIAAVLATPSPRYVLHRLLQDYGFQSAQVEQLAARMESLPTGRVFRSHSHQLLIDRSQIIVEPLAVGTKPVRVPEPGTYVLSPVARIKVEKVLKTADFIVETQPAVCMLDADGVRFPLTVRTVVRGDRFVPLGMKGSKLVSDFLTDRKLSLFEKQRQLVVVDAAGAIVWVVSLRPSEKHKVTEGTKTILRMELLSSE